MQHMFPVQLRPCDEGFRTLASNTACGSVMSADGVCFDLSGLTLRSWRPARPSTDPREAKR